MTNVGFEWAPDRRSARMVIAGLPVESVPMWCYHSATDHRDVAPNSAHGFYEGRTLTHVMFEYTSPCSKFANGFGEVIEVELHTTDELPEWMRPIVYTFQHQGVSLPDTGTS